jgi:TetR/AcrR family acrAB operon transcriptional repressor
MYNTRFIHPGEADMARRTKAEAEQTRQKILKAALDLFVEKGYERTTFEDVATRIRLTKGAVYWHFKSKPDLFAELVAGMSATHYEQVSRVLPAPASLDGLIAHFVERAHLIVSKPVNRKYFLMLLSLDWPAAKFIPIKRRLRQVGTGPFEVIESTLAALQEKGEVRPDTDIATTTAVLGAVWLGLLKLQIDRCLEIDLAKAIRSGFGAIIDAVKA